MEFSLQSFLKEISKEFNEHKLLFSLIFFCYVLLGSISHYLVLRANEGFVSFLILVLGIGITFLLLISAIVISILKIISNLQIFRRIQTFFITLTIVFIVAVITYITLLDLISKIYYYYIFP